MSVEEQKGTTPFLCGVESPLEIQYDWESDHSMGAVIVQAMVEEARVDATDVPQSFYESIDPDALDDLFRPQISGSSRMKGKLSFSFAGHYVTARSDGHITVESELGRVKRTGGNVMLTGDVPENVFNQLSAQLLGDVAFDRTSLFALYGRNADVAQSRLSQAGVSSDHAHILTHEPVARSAAQDQSNQSGRMSISSIVGSLEEFQSAIREQVFDLQQERNGFDSAELRFCFDSLQLLLEEEGTETTNQFITAVTETIEDVNGFGHFVLPNTYDSPPVQAVRALFDVIIEIKIGVDGLEQRFHLQDTSHTTQWFPI